MQLLLAMKVHFYPSTFEALTYEAQGEGTKGMQAVAQVILNRSKVQGKGICAIIQAPFQFSYRNHLKKGQMMPQRSYRKPYSALEVQSKADARDIAFRALTGPSDAFLRDSGVTTDTLWYKNKKSNPKWSRVYRISARIGNHTFYKE